MPPVQSAEPDEAAVPLSNLGVEDEDEDDDGCRLKATPDFLYSGLYISLYLEEAMQPLKLDEDIRPLSEFRAGVAAFVKQVNDTGRPLVLTQRGRGVAVLVDIHEFEAMRERLAPLEDIAVAEAQLAAGQGIPHAEARARIMESIRECR